MIYARLTKSRKRGPEGPPAGWIRVNYSAASYRASNEMLAVIRCRWFEEMPTICASA